MSLQLRREGSSRLSTGAAGRRTAGAPSHAEALARVLDGLAPLTVERADLSCADGRILRDSIRADRDLPPFDRATMDGFALRHREAVVGATMPVAGRVAAGATFAGRVPPGACVAVATGAPVPRGLDTVVEFERTREGRDSGRVTFISLPPAGASIHRRGRDARCGAVLAAPGVRLRPQHLGLAATVGATKLSVGPRPSVAILTSGDEIVRTGRPRPEQIRDGNGPMLEAAVAACGAVVAARAHVPDETRAAVAALRSQAKLADVLVTVGGISAGERDPFVDAIAALHGTVQVRGASIQPGGPITVWRLPARASAARPRTHAPASGRRARRGTIVVGLPGNPVSALVCAHLFLWPILARLQGADDATALPWRRVRLAGDVQPNARRTMFRPARMKSEEPGLVEIAPWAGSGDLTSTALTHGVVEVPPSEERTHSGAMLRFLPWAWLAP